MNKITVFWSWNSKITKKDIRKHLQSFYEQGIEGVFIHARAGLKLNYLSADWFDMFDCVLDEAKKHQIEVNIYDEEGWPSGFAGGLVPKENITYQQIGLMSKELVGKEIKKENLYVIFDVKHQLVDFHLIQDNQLYLCFYKKINPHYSDLLNEESTFCFLKHTHEVYKTHYQPYFGNHIQSIFTDEPQLMNHALPYTMNFEAQFYKTYNRDFKSNLYLIADPTDQGMHFRFQYWKLVSQLFLTNYTKIISDWCKNNNLSLTGHFPVEEGYCTQVNPTGSIMPHYEYFDIPGIDHLGRRRIPIQAIKQVVSVAKQMGKKDVISESFGCSGHDVTFRELLDLWVYQAFMGINVVCYHLSAFSLKGSRKRDYPPVFSYQNSVFKHFNLLNKRIKKVNETIENVKYDTKLVVLSGISSFWCLTDTKNTTALERELSTEFRNLSESLLDNHYDFDYADEELLGKYGSVRNNKLVINQMEYEVLIVPKSICMFSSTLCLIQRFINEGGKVLFVNDLPYKIDGLNGDISQNINQINIIENRKELLEKQLEGYGIYPNVKLMNELETDKLRNIYVTSGYKDRTRIIMIYNRDHLPKTGFIYLNDEKYHLKLESYESIIIYCNREITYFSPLKDEIMPLYKKPTQMEITRVLPLNFKLRELNHNCLTLDQASAWIDGKLFSEKYVLQLQDEVLTYLRQTYTNEVRVNYSFKLIEIPKIIFIGIEDFDGLTVFVNSIQVEKSELYYIDQSIKLYDINETCHLGENVVSLVYQDMVIHPQLDENVFETERNRYSEHLEIESIYVIGQFDVRNINHFIKDKSIYSLDTGFEIIPYQEKYTTGKIVENNLWFYKGEISLTTSINMSFMNNSTLYMIIPTKGTIVELFINKRKVNTVLSNYEVDITTYFKQGENEITLFLTSSLRNCLGPHHFYQKESYFVGPGTFKGEKSWVDFIFNKVDTLPSSTYDEKYHFVEWGLDEKIIIKEIIK